MGEEIVPVAEWEYEDVLVWDGDVWENRARHSDRPEASVFWYDTPWNAPFGSFSINARGKYVGLDFQDW